MSLHNNNIAPERQALPVTRSSRARRFFRSALGVALMVMVTLCSTFDAEALKGQRAIDYGTLSYSIPGMDNSYTPGKRYTLNATFMANAKVFGTVVWNGFLSVSAGGQTLGRQGVKVYNGKPSSVSVSFTAPTDGSPLKISYGYGSKVYGSITIPAKKMKNLPDEPNPDSNTGDNGNTTGADDQNPGDQDPGAENPGDETQPAEDNNPLDDLLSGIKDNDLVNAVQKWFDQDPLGLEQTATPDEAVVISSLAALLSLLLGGAGAVGGGAGGAFGGLAGGSGGAIPSPVEEVPGDTPPVQDPYQSVEDRYVTRDPDGSITIKDPITGEERLYLPDGQGGYDNPLGGGFQSEQDMLEHLAMLDRNSELLSQDAATAAKNQAEQHAQFEEQAKRESAEATEYKEWKANEERKEAQIIKLADKYGVEANEEAVRRAIKTDQIKAGIESAKQQAIAADKNVTVVGLESTKNVAATSLVLIPLALSGVGTVSVGTMAKAKVVQSGFSMAKEITDKVGDAYVEGKSLGKAAAHGVVSGTIEVAKNYAGDIGGKAAKLVPKAGEIGQKILNLTTEAAVVVGGDGVKEGLDEYNKSGDLQKALDASIKGMQKSAKTHVINKVAEVGIDKSKEFIKSRTSAVHRTRVMADDAAKKVTAGQQAVTRTQKQVTEAQRRVTFTQQNATRTRQQVTAAQGKVNTANEQLRTANGKVAAAEQELGQARTPAEASRAQAELKTAQQGAAQAQQNVNQARTELQTAQRVDTATQRVAQQAEQNLQKAQWGAQKAQSDLQTATAQRDQAMRDAWDAEQQAEVNEKLMSQVGGSDIMGGYRAIEEHLKNEGYLPKDDK